MDFGEATPREISTEVVHSFDETRLDGLFLVNQLPTWKNHIDLEIIQEFVQHPELLSS